jgi:hypothetical protein
LDVIVVCQHFASAAERLIFEDCSHDFDILLKDRDDPALTSCVDVPHLSLFDGWNMAIVTSSEG